MGEVMYIALFIVILYVLLCLSTYYIVNRGKTTAAGAKATVIESLEKIPEDLIKAAETVVEDVKTEIEGQAATQADPVAPLPHSDVTVDINTTTTLAVQVNGISGNAITTPVTLTSTGNAVTAVLVNNNLALTGKAVGDSTITLTAGKLVYIVNATVPDVESAIVLTPVANAATVATATPAAAPAA